MSTRAFTRTLPDQVSFSPGGAPVNQDNITVMALVKSSDSFGWIFGGTKAGTSVWAEGRDAGNWFTWGDFSSGVAFNPAGHWCWIGYTRATGTMTWHFKDYTAGGAWAHTAGTGNPGAGSGPIDSIQVSGYGGSAAGAHFVGSVAVLSADNSVWTNLGIEAACTANAADLLAAGPSWMTLWNQASTGTAVSDVTGGGGNQSAITGTSIDSDEPPGFNWSLSSTTHVTSTLSAPWNVRAAVSRTVSTPWALRALVSGSLSAPWAQRASVASSLAAPWSVRGVVTGTLTAPWTLRGHISTLLGTPWIVRKRVTSSLQTLWVVDGVPLSGAAKPSIGAASLTQHLTAYPEAEVTAYL